MAQVTIHHDAGVEVVVIDGAPPVDQSAEVAALTAEVATLNAEVSALTAQAEALVTERDAAIAATADKQAELDALNTGIDALQGQGPNA
jgi:peptidoglycan hydrolase CwlO-like protein